MVFHADGICRSDEVCLGDEERQTDTSGQLWSCFDVSLFSSICTVRLRMALVKLVALRGPRQEPSSLVRHCCRSAFMRHGQSHGCQDSWLEEYTSWPRGVIAVDILSIASYPIPIITQVHGCSGLVPCTKGLTLPSIDSVPALFRSSENPCSSMFKDRNMPLMLLMPVPKASVGLVALYSTKSRIVRMLVGYPSSLGSHHLVTSSAQCSLIRLRKLLG